MSIALQTTIQNSTQYFNTVRRWDSIALNRERYRRPAKPVKRNAVKFIKICVPIVVTSVEFKSKHFFLKFSFTKIHLNVSAVKWRPFCPKRDELIHVSLIL